ncbi:hypothetical protein PHMEG_0002482 [Phytophthora megakarya]|uniref:Uncharacterized protein n=1 Tax=Phytophthora megakarya TaxID=4795 RepID=A0A225WYX7_9STRA|nr:hypothetical protein PHMEG_0002482 [Phytophthora megakarya]
MEPENKRIGRRKRNPYNVAMAWNADEHATFNSVVSFVTDSELMMFPTEAAELLLLQIRPRRDTTSWSLKPNIAILPPIERTHEVVVCKGGCSNYRAPLDGYRNERNFSDKARERSLETLGDTHLWALLYY